MRIPGSLSLSLSPLLEKRARGEVGGSQTLVGSNHPSLPYWADVHLHTSLRPTPPFTPYWADTYLINTGWVPPCRGHPANINKVHVRPIWCNAAGSPAIHLSYQACQRLQAIIGPPNSMQCCRVPRHRMCHIRATKILIYFFQPSKRCLEDRPPSPKQQGTHM
jgi:hypothetical protein